MCQDEIIQRGSMSNMGARWCPCYWNVNHWGTWESIANIFSSRVFPDRRQGKQLRNLKECREQASFGALFLNGIGDNVFELNGLAEVDGKVKVD